MSIIGDYEAHRRDEEFDRKEDAKTDERTVKVINDLISERNSMRKDYDDLARYSGSLRARIIELEPMALLAKAAARGGGCRMCGHDHNMPPCPTTNPLPDGGK